MRKTIDEMIKLGSCKTLISCRQCPFSTSDESIRSDLSLTQCKCNMWIEKNMDEQTRKNKTMSQFSVLYIKHIKKIKLLDRILK